MNKYYYLTQYDGCGMFDENIIKRLETNNKRVKSESIDKLLKIVPEVKDKYNQELYNIMMCKGLYSENIDIIIEAWEHLAKGEITEALEVLGVDYYQLLSNYDVTPFAADILEEIADEDLRTNGIEANALYWYNEIDSRYIHVFNGYGNGFDYYDDMDDLLTYYFNDCIKDDFIKALKNE